MWSAQRLRNSANNRPPPRSAMFMCTQPTLSGTGTSRQVAPWSSEISTELVSASPAQRSPGTVTQRKMPSSQRPESVTTIGWRTKTPLRSSAGNSVCAGPQVRPESAETRRRTSAVSWLPARCAV